MNRNPSRHPARRTPSKASKPQRTAPIAREVWEDFRAVTDADCQRCGWVLKRLLRRYTELDSTQRMQMLGIIDEAGNFKRPDRRGHVLARIRHGGIVVAA